jgi:hypothetical protein
MKFKEYLDKFESILNNSKDKNTELNQLSSTASNDNELNPRQTDAVMSRCSGFLNGKQYNFIEQGSFKSHSL